MKINYDNLSKYSRAILYTKLEALKRLKSITVNRLHKVSMLTSNIKMYKYRSLSKSIEVEIAKRG